MSGAYQLTVNGNIAINGGATGGRINITNAGAVLRAKADLLDNTSTGGINQTAGKVILTGSNNTFYALTVKTLEIGDGTTAITITVPAGKTAKFAAIQNQEDAPPCSTCGSIMVRSGSCYKCVNCGTTSGCA